MITTKAYPFLLVIVLVLGFGVACLPSSDTPTNESIQIPTPAGLTKPVKPEEAEADLPAGDPTPQPEVTGVPSSEDSTIRTQADETSDDGAYPEPTLTENQVPEHQLYRVVFVEDNDVLNVRSGPGVANEIVGGLPPNSGGIEVTGEGRIVRNSMWLPIRTGDLNGWVNGRFLTDQVQPEEFCRDDEVRDLVSSLRDAFDARDGAQLAVLTADGRPLRLRRHWWNKEVQYEGEEIEQLFEDGISVSWGVADGSGAPIEGAFSETMLPLIDQNLTPATLSGCDEILHGGTAGLVKLPASYEGVNYYSLYRPAGPDDFELDWGTWVIGIERWQGQYYLSFLVHFEWEI